MLFNPLIAKTRSFLTEHFLKECFLNGHAKYFYIPSFHTPLKTKYSVYAIINEGSKVHDIYISFSFILYQSSCKLSMHLIHTYQTYQSTTDENTVTECFVLTICFLADELVHEKEKYKYICDDLDLTFTELVG